MTVASAASNFKEEANPAGYASFTFYPVPSGCSGVAEDNYVIAIGVCAPVFSFPNDVNQKALKITFSNNQFTLTTYTDSYCTTGANVFVTGVAPGNCVTTGGPESIKVAYSSSPNPPITTIPAPYIQIK